MKDRGRDDGITVAPTPIVHTVPYGTKIFLTPVHEFGAPSDIPFLRSGPLEDEDDDENENEPTTANC
jgi:hypothetical protein